MTDAFVKKISQTGYNPQQYVQEMCINTDGVGDLQVVRQMVQACADDTSGQLKRNVYKHYMQFIETAREISHLESEMYQLSHSLTEQMTLLSSLLETSITGNKPPPLVGNKSSVAGSEEGQNDDVKDPKKETSEKQKTSVALLTMIQDCDASIRNKERPLLHMGSLLELDSNSFTPVGPVQAFLLTDSIVFATPLSGKRSVNQPQFQFQISYTLDSLAVVNVRDLPDVKNAFKFLTVSDTRLFVCEKLDKKTEWLQKLDSAKKMQKQQPELEKVESEKPEPTTETEESEEKNTDSNPFGSESDDEDDSYGSGVMYSDECFSLQDKDSLPPWLCEIPEDLDSAIGQRDFHVATDLIERANKYCAAHSNHAAIIELRPKLDHRIRVLTEVLQNELKVSPDKSLHGGPRATRRAVSLLIRLGKANQACDLFLKHHGAMIKQGIKQLKIEGVTTLYIKRLCAVFFHNVMETARELEEAFMGRASCLSAFLVWLRHELHRFIGTFSRQVFTPQSTLTVVANCVLLVQEHCQQLLDIGVDITFFLNSLLLTDIERCIMDAREKLLEAIKLRSAEDKWRPLNFQSKASLQKFISNMKEIGIASIQSFVFDECFVSLTENTVAFSKAYLILVDDLLKLHSDETHTLVIQALVDTFHYQMKHIELSATACKTLDAASAIEQGKFVQKNGAFLVDTILRLCEHRYEETVKQEGRPLKDLRDKVQHWSSGAGPYITTVYL